MKSEPLWISLDRLAHRAARREVGAHAEGVGASLGRVIVTHSAYLSPQAA